MDRGFMPTPLAGNLVYFSEKDNFSSENSIEDFIRTHYWKKGATDVLQERENTYSKVI